MIGTEHRRKMQRRVLVGVARVDLGMSIKKKLDALMMSIR